MSAVFPSGAVRTVGATYGAPAYGGVYGGAVPAYGGVSTVGYGSTLGLGGSVRHGSTLGYGGAVGYGNYGGLGATYGASIAAAPMAVAPMAAAPIAAAPISPGIGYGPDGRGRGGRSASAGGGAGLCVGSPEAEGRRELRALEGRIATVASHWLLVCVERFRWIRRGCCAGGDRRLRVRWCAAGGAEQRGRRLAVGRRGLVGGSEGCGGQGQGSFISCAVWSLFAWRGVEEPRRRRAGLSREWGGFKICTSCIVAEKGAGREWFV